MTTTDPSTAERLIALEQRRAGVKRGKRRRPAEASRVLAAGAGTAAVLTMVTAMAQADQVAPVVEAPVVQSQQLTAFTTLDSGVPSRPDSVHALPAQQPAVQTVTIARPVRTRVSNARTSASR
jgi:phosphoribosylcarboxyaminoimidazole (NCAIR) mutase